MYTYIIYKSTNQACKRACTSQSSFESFSSLYQSHTTKSVSSLLLLLSSASLFIFSRVETLLIFLSTLAARLVLSHSYCFLVWRPVSSHRQWQGCPTSRHVLVGLVVAQSALQITLLSLDVCDLASQLTELVHHDSLQTHTKFKNQHELW